MIEFPLAGEGAGSVRVEADEEADGIVRAARPGEVAASAGRTLQDALDGIRPVAAAVHERLRALPAAPDRVTVEFGVKLSAEAGVIVARGTAEANFTVTLEWESGQGPRDRDRDQDDDPGA
ncbi:CU044_2847 family protein [Streptomyces sp. CMB-StM0423]|uniref:CU044_2847 family protein n=1 Tax=Streptomyces sp. CMB-StM0423 TaxID=2059884 RepID=UPI001F353D3B|nr:CU044_2847 family protein [Streptomyces sp. CMB-StM0423]